MEDILGVDFFPSWETFPWNTSINTSISVPSPYVSPDFISERVFIDLLLVWMVLWIGIVSFGLWSNAVNIRTFLRIGISDSVTSTFFVLALADFLLLFFTLFNIIGLPLWFLEARFSWFFKFQPLALCVYASFASSILNSYVTFLTIFLAVQRCLCIIKPFHFKTMVPTYLTRFILVSYFFFQTSRSTAHVMAKTGLREEVNSFNVSQIVVYLKPYDVELDKNLLIVFLTASVVASDVIFVVCLIYMRMALRASVKFRKDAASGSKGMDVEKGRANVRNDANGSDKVRQPLRRLSNEELEAEKARSKENMAIAQVSWLCMIFLVSTLPRFPIIIVPYFYSGTTWTPGPFFKSYMTLSNVYVTSFVLNSSVNFLVYYKYNSKFRRYCFHK